MGIGQQSILDGISARSWQAVATEHAGEHHTHIIDPWERDLVRRLQSGDQAAFRDLVLRYQSLVSSTIYGILRNRAESEDIAQEVFTRVYFGLANFAFRSSLSTWIRRITINECYVYLRRSRSKKRDGQAVPIQGNEMATGPSPEKRSVLRDLANKLLLRLPERDRFLLVLKEVEGLSIQDLAAMTGTNEATVKVRLYRARQKLVKAARQLSAPKYVAQVPSHN